MFLLNKHRVAKAEETVLLFHRGVVRFHHSLLVVKGGDEHQERALGQVEVGDECIHRLELVARVNENAGVTAHCGNGSVLARNAFDGAARGRANANETSACGFAFVDDFCTFFGLRIRT